MMSGGSKGAVVFASSSSGSEGPVAVLVLSNGVFVGYVPVVVDGQHTPVAVSRRLQWVRAGHQSDSA